MVSLIDKSPVSKIVWVIVASPVFGLGSWLSTTVGQTSDRKPALSEEIDFAFDVKPILSDKCFHCHGPDAADVQGDLRLDLSPSEQERDPAIVANSREDSLVWRRIIDEDDPMPPEDSHKHLTSEEKEIIGRWIDQGAVYEKHWSYSPIKIPEVPTPKDPDAWARNAVDRFLLEKMQRRGLPPATAAPMATLLRRVYLDLTGLPPTPSQTEAFLKDPSPEAYRAVVDRLLDDPKFGEHWASWWLDLVRYADSVGFHGDQPKPGWIYRDWVVNAFNSNMPFDQFSHWQIAGDLVDDSSGQKKLQAIIGSGYNRLTPETAEFGAQPKEYQAIYAADRVANFGEVWLGSSTGCARCHDHKYDPFTARDFYSLAAVFADVDHPDISQRKPNLHWLPYELVPQNEEQEKQLKPIDEKYKQFIAKYPEAGAWEVWKHSFMAGAEPKLGDWKADFEKAINERQELAKTIPHISVTRAKTEPRVTRVLDRGNWMDEDGEIASPRPPIFLGGKEEYDHRFTRLDLARWLFEEDNPLTSRVLVNRLWAQFFGRGISSNVLDVGNQGAPPTHRELLDWLSTEFRTSGWNLRHVMRLMVLSQAYQQSSDQTEHQLTADPSNRWFARQTPKRLSAEVLRDQTLFVSGLLVDELGGPSVFPYQPDKHWDALNFPKRKYEVSSGASLYRRSIYTWIQRTFPHPAMTVFDAPNRESCTAERSDSNTPLQSLTTLNETLCIEAARNFAQRAMVESDEHEARIDSLFLHALQRKPTVKERKIVNLVYRNHKQRYSSKPESADAFCEIGESEVAEGMDKVEVASYAAVARILLNLHELVTRS